MQIKWEPATKVFGKDSKVRVLFSDDYGQTYKYVLATGLPNNGTATVLFPNGVVLGKEQTDWDFGTASNKGTGRHEVKGVFRIEVENHIAYAAFNHYTDEGDKNGLDTPKPYWVQRAKLRLTHLPEASVTVAKEAIPAKAEEQAETSCANKEITWEHKGEDIVAANHLSRHWKATDQCGNTAEFTQYIYYAPESPKGYLRFTGDLPESIHYECWPEKFPEAPKTLPVAGGMAPRITYTEEKGTTEGRFQVVRTWHAEADDAFPITYQQILDVKDTQKPVLSAYPKGWTVKSEEEIPPQDTNITATDNCAKNLQVRTGWEYGTAPNGLKQKKYVWFVSDGNGNEEHYEQVFTIDPNSKPQPPIQPTPKPEPQPKPAPKPPVQPTPEPPVQPQPEPQPVPEPPVTPMPHPTPEPPVDTTIKIYNGVSLSNSANYFRVEAHEDAGTPIEVLIFNEEGVLVYHSERYDSNPTEQFHGKANVAGVVGSRALGIGTYFYVLTYTQGGAKKEKTGWLYLSR